MNATADQLRTAATLAADTLAGLRANCPAGAEVAASVEAQLATAELALRLAADRLELGAVYDTPTARRSVSDLVDDTGPLYALTDVQLTARDERVRRAVLAEMLAEQNVLVQA